MTMIEGRTTFTVEGKSRVIAVGDDSFVVPRCNSHGMKAFEGKKMTLKERTNPTGDFKEL
jgi:mannose-6-phosphate isomerase-like protein (cupin superfamily)